MFSINNSEGWNETELRPDEATMQRLEAEAKELAAEALKHEPGMGWHHVPGKPEFVFNQTWYGSEYWWVCWPTSEGAILAETAIFCKAHGLNFVELQKQAHPNVIPYELGKDDFDDLLYGLVPTLQDVLDDLTDINYHSLCSAIELAAEAKMSFQNDKGDK
jgi:hypothetical protein